MLIYIFLTFPTSVLFLGIVIVLFVQLHIVVEGLKTKGGGAEESISD